jgi:hypothetical protein
VTEAPEHRACRTNTSPERRGVEAALGEWRLGDANWRNIYVGNEHVGVSWVPGLPKLNVEAMNGRPGCGWVCPRHDRACLQPHVDDEGHACVSCTTADALSGSLRARRPQARGADTLGPSEDS